MRWFRFDIYKEAALSKELEEKSGTKCQQEFKMLQLVHGSWRPWATNQRKQRRIENVLVSSQCPHFNLQPWLQKKLRQDVQRTQKIQVSRNVQVRFSLRKRIKWLSSVTSGTSNKLHTFVEQNTGSVKSILSISLAKEVYAFLEKQVQPFQAT